MGGKWDGKEKAEKPKRGRKDEKADVSFGMKSCVNSPSSNGRWVIPRTISR